MIPVIRCFQNLLSATAAAGLLLMIALPVAAQPPYPVPTDIRPSFFLAPGQPAPADFSPAEAQELHRRYGIHAAQNPVNQAMTLAADTLGWRDRLALELISRHAPVLEAVGREEQINPLVLAAILFDEIRHEKPTEDVLTRWGLAKTLGLAQLSLHELVMQGYFDGLLEAGLKSGLFDARLREQSPMPDLKIRQMKPSELRTHLRPAQILEFLPPELLQATQQALLDPAFNIQVLGRQLSRVRHQLGIAAHERFLQLDDFHVQHKLARVVVFHNGRLDYAAKILSALRLPQLEIALSGCYPRADSLLI